MDIVGHKKILDFLEKIISRDTTSQSYIFSGPEGVGKFSVAKYFARKINGDTESAIEEDIVILHPEIEEIKGVVKKRDIKIESIRELQRRLSMTSSGNRKKIAIIDDADRLTLSAQNSLLKTLEEPPRNSIIILVIRDLSRLLPTIRSRCQNVNFGILDSDEIRKMIPSDDPAKDEIEFFSCGRPGWAMRLVDNKDELSGKIEILRQFRSLLSSDTNERFSQAESLSKDIPKLIGAMDLWMVVLGKIISGDDYTINIRKEKALGLVGEIEKSRRVLMETNSNARLVLENLFLNF